MDAVDAVKRYLKGQNLEQIGRVDEAVELYETAVAERFDSSGPYDRLIALYAERARHADVVRVAEAALASVRTHPQKQEWYERMQTEARKAAADVPVAAPKRS
jgi:hypothetical protein